MTDAELAAQAEGEYEKARKKLASAKGKNGQGAENQYNACWKRLVALGLRPKLKGRYNV